MVAWPTTGGSEGTWNDEMKTFVEVGHNANGTHNQEDWTPSSYAGEESITFPNGWIVKTGEESVAADTTDEVTYGTAFPTAFKLAFVSYKGADKGNAHPANVQPKSGSETSILQVTNGVPITKSIYWVAIGY